MILPRVRRKQTLYSPCCGEVVKNRLVLTHLLLLLDQHATKLPLMPMELHRGWSR
jgi:hypothetical protein